MNLELFNKTNMVKEVPKYNYNGKIRIPSLGTYPIKDYMVSFYKPYAKAGVTVRAIAQEEEIEEEVKSVIEGSEPEIPNPELPKSEDNGEDKVNELTSEDTVEEIKSEEGNTIPADEVEETTSSDTEETSSDEIITEEIKKVYTEVELQELKIADLKELAEGLGLTVEGDLKKKAPYIEAILASQK